MSEEAPNGEQPKKPEEELGGAAVSSHDSTQIEVQGASGPAAEPVETHHQKGDDSQSGHEPWDGDKARAIADAVLEEDKRTGSADLGLDLLAQGNAIKADDMPDEDRIRLAGRWVRAGKTFDVDQERKDVIIDAAREATRKTDNVGEKAHHYITAEMRLRGEQMSRKFNRVAEPYEELYDSDPARFANMPTREFMHIGETYKRTKHDLELLNNRERPLRELAHTLNDAAGMNRMNREELNGERYAAIDLSPEDDDALATVIAKSLGRPEQKDSIKNEFQQLREGDKSPEQLQSDQAHLVAEYYWGLGAKRDTYKDRVRKIFGVDEVGLTKLPATMDTLLYPRDPDIVIARPLNHDKTEATAIYNEAVRKLLRDNTRES